MQTRSLRHLFPLFVALAVGAASGCAVPTPEGHTALMRPVAPKPLDQALRDYVFEGRKLDGLPQPERLSRKEANGFVREKWRLVTEPGHTAYLILRRPAGKGPFPVVLVQHFMGSHKDDFVIQSLVTLLSGRGFLAAAIDGRHRGERAKESGVDLMAAVRETLRTGRGRPWLIDTVFDMSRAVDLLASRDDVDPERIGVTGMSEGGIETWMLAAIDQRVAVAVPIVGVTRLRTILEGGGDPDAQIKLMRPALEEYAKRLGEPEVNAKVLTAAWKRLLPGYVERFDTGKVLSLIAPRPLLILNHEKDELFPLEGAEEVVAAARKRYEALGAADRLDFQVAPGLEHASYNFMEIQAMVAWFVRWLEPAAPPARVSTGRHRVLSSPGPSERRELQLPAYPRQAHGASSVQVATRSPRHSTGPQTAVRSRADLGWKSWALQRQAGGSRVLGWG